MDDSHSIDILLRIYLNKNKFNKKLRKIQKIRWLTSTKLKNLVCSNTIKFKRSSVQRHHSAKFKNKSKIISVTVTLNVTDDQRSNLTSKSE